MPPPPLVTLHGPQIRGVRKYLGGAPTANKDALIGAPAHERLLAWCLLRLDLTTGAVTQLETKTPKGPFKWLRAVLAPDGSVVCIPACARTVLRIHPDGHLQSAGGRRHGRVGTTAQSVGDLITGGGGEQRGFGLRSEDWLGAAIARAMRPLGLAGARAGRS